MRVLVVEDVRSLADDIAEGLRYHGFAADVAYDGLDAAAKLDATAYHVVILDRDLPGIHGDALCQIITQADKPAMVLMLTASGSPEDRVSRLYLGADDYLAKPFHFPELVLRVRALARRQPAAQPRILRAAGIELDPQQHAATRSGPPTTSPNRRPTPQEFESLSSAIVTSRFQGTNPATAVLAPVASLICTGFDGRYPSWSRRRVR
jgi:DNA-binding response OmpR family regulator